MEKLDAGSSISQIKIVGTVVSISGALIVTFYKGAPISSIQTQPSTSQPFWSLLAETSNWVIGGLFLATASLSLAIWNIAQVRYLIWAQILVMMMSGTTDLTLLSIFAGRNSQRVSISIDHSSILLLIWNHPMCTTFPHCSQRSKCLESKS